jgi:Leucine-rich repeat (LRR) protein
MRVLSADLVVLANRAPIESIEFLSLNGQDIEKLTSELEGCKKLDTLSLSRNQIYQGVEYLMGCKQLWHIDLSFNNIKSLEGLQHFAALGTLNLSKNLIPTTELQKLKQMPIIHISLKVHKCTFVMYL